MLSNYFKCSHQVIVMVSITQMDLEKQDGGAQSQRRPGAE